MKERRNASDDDFSKEKGDGNGCLFGMFFDVIYWRGLVGWRGFFGEVCFVLVLHINGLRIMDVFGCPE